MSNDKSDRRLLIDVELTGDSALEFNHFAVQSDLEPKELAEGLLAHIASEWAEANGGE